MMSKSEDWVSKAFKEAVDNVPFEDPNEEAEYQAYRRSITAHKMDILAHCGRIVGEARMNDLSGVVLRSNNTKILADFLSAVSMLCFSIGYKEGRKA